ncbi:MAG: hypothetical protein JWQ36_3297 [Enterovirga sp.]|jgi:ABC-type nitrate/sulfonate/bicarbonate transport system substrate-binding protein|nr:hypothetical protein [Enterovirga sp.]
MKSAPPVSRRTILAGASAAAAASAFSFPRPALAATRTVRFTLPWLAQGNSAYTYVGRAKGFFAKRGINLEIARGFGSLAAAQAVGNGQFEFGTMLATPLILTAAQGMPLAMVATIDYESTMGVGVLSGSSVASGKDLAGKKVAAVPSSGEYPFFAPYARLAGIDPASVDMVNVDPKILERTLIDRQVDAIVGVASASLPVLMSQKQDVRWMLFSKAGLAMFGQAVATREDVIKRDPALVGAMVEGLMESLAYTLVNPDESIEIFLKEVPEISLNPNGKAFAQLGMGLSHYCTSKPEAKTHGLGWGSRALYDQMVDLVLKYLSGPNVKQPSPGVFHDEFGGTVKLTDAQWAAVDARIASFAKLMA